MKQQNKENKEKIVVTGGAGFIGSHIVDRGVKEGYEVHVIDNLSGGKKENVHPNAHFHLADITNYDEIAPIIKNATFVFHLAALPRVQFSIDEPVLSNEVNVVGTINVLKAASEYGVKKVIYSSSGSVYGDPDILPIVETMPANPLSPYALQKYVGEMKCVLWKKVYGLDTVCLRYFNIYGNRMDPNGAYALVIGKFMKLRKEGKPLTITGDGEQTRDFTHVLDAVEANFLAAQSNVCDGAVFNIGFGKKASINYVAELIGGDVEYIEARLEPKDNEANHDLARHVLGWTPRIKLEDGIQDLKNELNLS